VFVKGSVVLPANLWEVCKFISILDYFSWICLWQSGLSHWQISKENDLQNVMIKSFSDFISALMTSLFALLSLWPAEFN
jgi:hypothetical protein